MHASSPRSAVLAGATGLVGSHALRRLVDGFHFDEVVVLARRPLTLTHPRLQTRVVDFQKLDEVEPALAAAAFCALGTTIKTAGSEAAFRAVDYDAVVSFARWARRGGARAFALVSSVGAASDAGTFYLRVKGETEDAVAGLGYPRFVALRPSVLLGERNELRLGEAAARTLAPVINPLLQGGLRRYRGIEADRVAAALVAAALDGRPGRYVWEYEQIVGASPS